MSENNKIKKPETDDYANYSDIMSYEEYLAFMEDYSADTPALLCSANSHTEVAMLEAVLKSNNIPVIIKRRNAGDAMMVYMAMSSTQADLYVPSKLLEEAEMLLSDVIDCEEDAEADEDFLEYAEQKNFKRSDNARRFIFVVFFLPIIIVIAFALLNIFRGDFISILW